MRLLQVIRHTAFLHPNKMHTFDNLRQMNIEWQDKSVQKVSKRKKNSGKRKKNSGKRSDASGFGQDSSQPPFLTREDHIAPSSPMSASFTDNEPVLDITSVLSDPTGLVQWAIDQGLKMPDYVHKILGSSGAQISELKYMMRIVKRPETRYGCIACEEFKCNQFVDFKLHMRDRQQFPQSKLWACASCRWVRFDDSFCFSTETGDID